MEDLKFTTAEQYMNEFNSPDFTEIVDRILNVLVHLESTDGDSWVMDELKKVYDDITGIEV